MECLLKISVAGTSRLKGVELFENGTSIPVVWLQSDNFKKFVFENHRVGGSAMWTFGLTVSGRNTIQYTYTIERYEDAGWHIVDTHTFEIRRGGSHSFEKTIDLSKDKETNGLTNPVIA